MQLPGVTDVDRAKEIIRSTGLLELKIVEQGPVATREALLRNGQVPQGMEIMPGASGGPAMRRPPSTTWCAACAAVTGRDLRSARPVARREQPAGRQLHAEHRRRAASSATSPERTSAAAGDHARRPRAVGADDRRAHHTDGRISGSFTQEEVQNLSLILRSGALPATLTYLEERTIGPSLGADSIRSGVIASLVGLLLVMVFMLVYYKLSGVNAVIALVFNLVILLGLMAYIGAVMTLPGIAGFVLTMGIGVDSNVLIFERIKEELEAAARRARGDQRRVQPRVPDAASTRTSRRSSRRRSCSSSAPGRSAASPSRCSSVCSRTCSRRLSCRRRCSRWRCAPAAGRDAFHLSHAHLQKHQFRLPALALARRRAVAGSSSSRASP